ncbi:hypothetical protein DFH27DRAFT_650850 [Peziza echinospora]|nr:hypothetical protein DFH27DRAFT_650850 [Peziza echinospora]
MRDPPKEVVESWPKPNYINPESQGQHLRKVVIILSIFATIFVCMRVYVRRIMLNSIGIDDILMVLAFLLTLTLATAVSVGTNYGWGMHIWDMHRDWATPSRFISWISQIIYIQTAGTIKLSILFSYLRLSTTRRFTNIIYISMAFIILWMVTFTFLSIFRCHNVARYWQLQTQVGCLSEAGVTLSCTYLNLFSDILLVILPISTLWKLRFPTRQKVILIILIGLGGVGCIAGAIRIYYLDIATRKSYDVTWYGSPTWQWSSLECIIGILCGCIATLRPLIRLICPHILGSHCPGIHQAAADLENMKCGIPCEGVNSNYTGHSDSSTITNLKSGADYTLTTFDEPKFAPDKSRPWTDSANSTFTSDPRNPAMGRRSIIHEYDSSMEGLTRFSTAGTDPGPTALNYPHQQPIRVGGVIAIGGDEKEKGGESPLRSPMTRPIISRDGSVINNNSIVYSSPAPPPAAAVSPVTRDYQVREPIVPELSDAEIHTANYYCTQPLPATPSQAQQQRDARI